MKKLFKIVKLIFTVILALIIAAVVVCCFYLPKYLTEKEEVSYAPSDRDGIVVMSTNVRYYTPLDLFRESWFYRASLIREDICGVEPDIIGFQEATFIHYDYLQDIMAGYDSVIGYRDDFILSEGCPIFYRTDKFELIDSGSFWLSETPQVMSKDWGSEHYRICTFVVLRDISSGENFAVFNTHLDSKSEEARIQGIGVVLDKIAELGDIPAVLMGDLNDKAGSDTIDAALESFDDTRLIAEDSDDGVTYHGFGEAKNKKLIDYIMITHGDATVSKYEIIDNCHDGVYSSDHSSIYVEFTLK